MSTPARSVVLPSAGVCIRLLKILCGLRIVGREGLARTSVDALTHRGDFACGDTDSGGYSGCVELVSGDTMMRTVMNAASTQLVVSSAQKYPVDPN